MAGDNLEEIAGSGENICTLPSESPISEDCTGSKESNDHNSDHGVSEALSNYLVLKNILSNLENSDLDSCCQVNKCWNSVADPLLVRYYDIRLDHFINREIEDINSQSYVVTITKQATYKDKQVNDCKYSIEDAIYLLENALKTEKISITLKVSWYKEHKSVITSFLAKFGSFVEKFYPDEVFTIAEFSELLVSYLPNLKHLDLCDTAFDDDEYFDERLRNSMKHLKRIDFSNIAYDKLSLINIFRMAPNLKEIYDFPVLLVDALIETKKAGCVKSLSYPNNRIDDSFQTALEKLASLDLKLEAFSFEYSLGWPEESLSSEGTGLCVRKILQSSSQSLQRLTLHKCEPFDFQLIPPMNSLQEIKFWLKDTNEDCVTKFFSPNINLQKLFPNVSVVNIPTLLCHYTIADIAAHFPEDQFAPWGAQIGKLKLIDVSLNILRQLSKLFPSVKDLQIFVRMKTVTNDLKLILPAIGQCWPELEHLTVIVAYSEYSVSHQVGDDEQCSFDSVFTGIPDDVIYQLRGPLSSIIRNFSEEEIEKFKKYSTIRQLRKLKVLKFDLDSPDDCNFMEKLSAITSVSKEFGFQFLPDLKLVVNTQRDDMCPQGSSQFFKFILDDVRLG